MELLGDPQRSFGVIHVTGTNGKTSTTRMIEALLRELGLSTGRFTSPHLHHMTERIALNGQPIDAQRFLAAYDDVLPYIELIDARSVEAGEPTMTYFEVVTAVAFDAFADAPVDVAAIEVGMGGAWDATNVADGAVSVITPIGLDHERFLGSRVEEIAAEKSGIIKPGALLVSSVQDPAVAAVLLERVEQVGARAVFEGSDIGVLARQGAVGGQVVSLRGIGRDYDDVFLPLYGPHQAQNACLAVAAVEGLIGDGQALEPSIVAEALGSVTSPGRMEVVRRSPTVLVDAAHNPAGAQALRAALGEAFAFTRLVGVIAVLADKDALGILSELEPVLDEVVLTRSRSPRAMDPARLFALASEVFGDQRCTLADDLPQALELAVELADDGGLGGVVVATGSVTTAADVRLLFGQDDRMEA